MKKLVVLVSVAVLSVSAMYAQEAFKNVGLSAELGTTGIGVNVSYPVVTDHLILTAGYNFPSFSYKKTYTVSGARVNSMIDDMNAKIEAYNASGAGSIAKVSHVPSELTAEGKGTLNFSNFKFLAEYYPSKTNSFHITAGVFIGGDNRMDLTAQLDDQSWSTYKAALDANSKLGDKGITGLDKAARFNFDDQTVYFNPKKNGLAEGILEVSKVKPYLGVGIGRSVPDQRMGFQMELGFYYQNHVRLESDELLPEFDSTAKNEETVDDILKVFKTWVWYPQLTFRWTFRIGKASYNQVMR